MLLVDIDDVARYRALAARVLKPTRARLARCLSQVTTAPEEAIARELEVDPKDKFKAALSLVVTAEGGWAGPASAREAWETVAPMEWLDDDRRRFERGGEAPATVRDAVTLASDPEGVSTAETLARTFAGQCHALLKTGQSGQSIGWKFVDPKRYRSRFCARAQARSGEMIFNAAYANPATKRGGEVQKATLPSTVTAELEAIRNELIRSVGPVAWDVVALVGWHLRLVAHEIESPFEPLLSLWELGYALDELTDERTVLAAPSI
jgi:hypothetical protein